MTDDKRKICVWVPEDLYSDVIKAGYNGPTSAVTKGLKLLVGTGEVGMSPMPELIKFVLNNNEKIDSTLVSNLLAENKKLKNEVERLTEDLQKSPSQVELVELRAKNEGLQKLLEEKDKRIEDLTNSVEMLSVFANYFKTLNQNK